LSNARLSRVLVGESEAQLTAAPDAMQGHSAHQRDAGAAVRFGEIDHSDHGRSAALRA
jgi:hypothetical protein